MATAYTAYCTSAEVQLILSSTGVTLRVDDDATATADCIEEASADIIGACTPRYTEAGLSASRWVNRRARWLSAYYLCIRRNNPAAKSLKSRYDDVQEELRQIREDGRMVPNASESKESVPVVSGQRVSMGPIPNRVTTEPSRSTGTPENYSRVEPIVDPGEYFDWGI